MARPASYYWLRAGSHIKDGHRLRFRYYMALMRLSRVSWPSVLLTAYLTLIAALTIACLATSALWYLAGRLGLPLP